MQRRAGGAARGGLLVCSWLICTRRASVWCLATSPGGASSAAHAPPRPWLPARARDAAELRVLGGAAYDARARAASELCTPEPALMRELRAEASASMPGGAHMVSGPVQGRLLALLARSAGCVRVLEIGTFVGYASLWLASALPPHGTLVTCERDERCAAIAERYFARAVEARPAPAGGMAYGAAGGTGGGAAGGTGGGAAGIELRVGMAADTIEALAAEPGRAPFDLVFIDADKRRCAEYIEQLLRLDLISEKNHGGLVVIDNVLFGARVLQCAHRPPPAAAHGGEARGGRPLPGLSNMRNAPHPPPPLLLVPADAPADGAAAPAHSPQPSPAQPPAGPAPLSLASLFEHGSRRAAIAESMHEFNAWLRDHPHLGALVLPLRDGLSLARRRASAPAAPARAQPGHSATAAGTAATAAPPAAPALEADPDSGEYPDSVDLEDVLCAYAAAHSSVRARQPSGAGAAHGGSAAAAATGAAVAAVPAAADAGDGGAAGATAWHTAVDGARADVTHELVAVLSALRRPGLAAVSSAALADAVRTGHPAAAVLLTDGAPIPCGGAATGGGAAAAGAADAERRAAGPYDMVVLEWQDLEAAALERLCARGGLGPGALVALWLRSEQLDRAAASAATTGMAAAREAGTAVAAAAGADGAGLAGPAVSEAYGDVPAAAVDAVVPPALRAWAHEVLVLPLAGGLCLAWRNV